MSISFVVVLGFGPKERLLLSSLLPYTPPHFLKRLPGKGKDYYYFFFFGELLFHGPLITKKTMFVFWKS